MNLVDWSSVFSFSDSIDIAWCNFALKFKALIEKHTPFKVIYAKRSCAPYLPFSILRLIRLKKSAWKRFTRTRSNSDYAIFRKLASRCRADIRAHRSSCEMKVLRAASLKAFYGYVNCAMSPKTGIGPVHDMSDPNNLLYDNVDKANAFNVYFQSVFTHDNGLLPDFAKRVNANMAPITFSVNDVRSVLKLAGTLFTISPDGFPAYILSKLACELAQPICILFNMSLSQDVTLDCWKLANIIPIYKGRGSRVDVKNYRPISLTSVFCKAMEKLLKNIIIDFLDNNNLISSCQSGFRSVRSTLSQLILTQAHIIKDANNRVGTDAVYTDLPKAFDSLSHPKLLHKLKAYGLEINTFNWIKAFLCGRRQRVVINSAYSSWLSCTSGVPQGSVLGPLLFLIFINNLPQVVKYSNILLYADDAKVMKMIANCLDSIHLQIDLNSIGLWCNTWQLALNVAKCFTVRFGLTDRPVFSYSFYNSEITLVDCVTDLGVIFNSHMSFSNHCHAVVKKAYARANLILRYFYTNDRDFFCVFT